MLPGQLALEIPTPGSKFPPKHGTLSIRACVGGATFRTRLDRGWRAGGPLVLFLGHNPNKADASIDDGTSWRWTGYAWRWGYAGYMGGNLFPFRTARPAEARSLALDLETKQLRAENTREVVRMGAAASLVVACWGVVPAPVHAHAIGLLVAIREARRAPLQVHALGLTAGGFPVHPAARGRHRPSDDAQPILWRELS